MLFVEWNNIFHDTIIARVWQLCHLHIWRETVLPDIWYHWHPLHVVCPGRRGGPHGRGHRVRLDRQQGQDQVHGGEVEVDKAK